MEIIYDEEGQDYLTKETQSLLNLLDMRTVIYNIETCVGSDGKPYIMEVLPRGGGNSRTSKIGIWCGLD